MVDTEGEMRYVLFCRSVVEHLRNVNSTLGGQDKKYVALQIRTMTR